MSREPVRKPWSRVRQALPVRQAEGMSAPESRWVSPESPPASAAGESDRFEYTRSAPLGGSAPVAEPAPVTSNRRQLLLGTILLVFALVAGFASLLSWRDYGRFFGSVTETGWDVPGGDIGRGWLAVLLGVVLAAGGLLIVTDHQRSGRVVAVLGGVGLILLAVGEWGLGAGRLASGPGAGLWVEFIIGCLTIAAVGMLGTPRDAET